MNEQDKQELQQRVQDLLNSEIGQAFKTMAAYAIRKTKTVRDDEVLENADEVSGLIAAEIKSIAVQHPTDKEMKEAVMRLLKLLVESTDNKLDDRIFSVIDVFF